MQAQIPIRFCYAESFESKAIFICNNLLGILANLVVPSPGAPFIKMV